MYRFHVPHEPSDVVVRDDRMVRDDRVSVGSILASIVDIDVGLHWLPGLD